MKMKKNIVILAGGQGTRLWPVSRKKTPKQFVDLLQNQSSLLSDTVKRVENIGEYFILCSEEQRSWSYVLAALDKKLKEEKFLFEPTGKNTAPAISFLAKYFDLKEKNSLVAILPSDHFVQNSSEFTNCLEQAFKKASQDKIVTLGIKPSSAHTGYGYLEVAGEDVQRFIEKPAQDKADEFYASGKHFWNAGIFVFSTSAFLNALENHAPEYFKIVDKLKDNLSNLDELYKEMPEDSIDFALMEKLSNLSFVPLDAGWSDLGSWPQLAEIHSGEKIFEEKASGNAYLSYALKAKKTAFVGTKDTMLVESDDALLVLNKNEAQSVKGLLAQIKNSNFADLTQSSLNERRPWGEFFVLLDTDYFKSKLIRVLPGKKLSYQSHKKRAEHWVVVKGQARVTLNDKVHDLKVGESIFIPLEAKHRIENPHASELMEFVEVQTGSYFGEDDITRYQDDFGRV